MASFLLEGDYLIPRKSYDDVKNIVESRGFILLEKEYKNNATKMRMSCDKHGEFSQSLNCIHNGNWCPSCGREIARE